VKGGASVEQRVTRMYEEAFGREPTETEMGAAREFFGGVEDEKAWVEYAHVLMNLKEFIFLR